MANNDTQSVGNTTGTRMRHGMLWASLLALVLVGGLATGAVAQQEVQQGIQLVDLPTTGMKSGQLTAKHDNSAEISGLAYTFHPKVAFASEEGSPMEWKDFKKGDRVQYHLKQERIDLLVLVLPQ